jgi:HEAT repeat protein
VEISEDIKEAREVFNALIKAKKAFRMYPQNNPVYTRTLADIYGRFGEFLDYHEELRLRITQHHIYYDSQEIYHNPEKEDNLALFFFKDGLRELNFSKGLTKSELEDFIKVLAFDVAREAADDDVVTLLWEKDFQHIQYVVDEVYLVDPSEEDYGIAAEEQVKEMKGAEDGLMKAYAEGVALVPPASPPIVPLSEKDLHLLSIELEKDAGDKTLKLSGILFGLFAESIDKPDLQDLFNYIRNASRFSMEHGDMAGVLQVVRRGKEVLNDAGSTDEHKRLMRMLSFYLGSEEIISLFADILDGGIDLDVEALREFIAFLDKNAIASLIAKLGDLKTIQGRKGLIEALIVVGRKDIPALSRGLEDERWYVVRNIIYILRRIDDKRAIEYLLKAVRHRDLRVRKEVIKALGEMGGREVVQTLRECLDDRDEEVRIVSAKAFAAMGSEAGKRILMDKISDKMFREKDVDEKKEFYAALARWKDSAVFEFLMNNVKKRTFFGRSRNEENRACAAFGLGLVGNREALPLLYKLREGGNGLLRDFSAAAIRKLEYGE